MSNRSETAAILFLAYKDYVKGVALRYAPMPNLAEDVVQQVFAEFIAKADEWDLDNNVKSLLGVMARNFARRYWQDELHKKPESLRAVAMHIQHLAEEHDSDQYQDDLRALQECLQKAPSKTRQLIEMHYFEGISINDLATKLNLNTDSIYQAIHRLRTKLRRCIEQALKGGPVHV